MQIHHAEFITSAALPEEYPESELPEVAFCGRSNVGKSSLMNSLLGRRNLVKTSKTPGKTRRLNYFRANEAIHLVDLPGYGFARVSKSERQSWQTMIQTYLLGRSQLRICVLLIDVRHPPMSSDLEMRGFLRDSGIAHAIVATKADKLKKTALQKSLTLLRGAFGPQVHSFSVPARLGRKELWATILAHCPSVSKR